MLNVKVSEVLFRNATEIVRDISPDITGLTFQSASVFNMSPSFIAMFMYVCVPLRVAPSSSFLTCESVFIANLELKSKFEAIYSFE